MTPRSGKGCQMSRITAGLLFLASVTGCTAWWPAQAASPDAAAAATAKRDSTRCLTQADMDACNDAIRRNPSDPQLLVALGDALVRAKRPADAVRHYRRAAALSPHMPGLAAKLSDAEEQVASERAPAAAKRTRYSNAAPETQSH